MERKIRWYDYITINIFYFGLTTRSQVLTPLILPLLVQTFVGDEVKGTAYGNLRLWAIDDRGPGAGFDRDTFRPQHLPYGTAQAVYPHWGRHGSGGLHWDWRDSCHNGRADGLLDVVRGKYPIDAIFQHRACCCSGIDPGYRPGIKARDIFRGQGFF